MAATTSTHFVYPPEYQHGDYVDTGHGPRRYVVQLMGEATASEDETDVVKVAIGDMVTQDGETATKFVIERVDYEMVGFTGIKLEFDRAPQKTLLVMGGANHGHKDWTRWGGRIDDGEGGTGNLLLTTNGGDQYDTYDITIQFRVK